MNSQQIPSKKKYVIGTRGSLLALTQCKQIKHVLEEKTGDEFELKIIKTEGDLNTENNLQENMQRDVIQQLLIRLGSTELRQKIRRSSYPQQ